MKARTPWLFGLVVSIAIAIGAGCAGKDKGKVDSLQKENAALKAKVQKLEQEAATAETGHPGPALPAALDAMYPPKSEAPVWTMSMLGMAMPLELMMADLFDQDVENVAKDFEAFAAAYAKTRDLVPEWSKRFPQEPVDELGEALKSGDPGKVMPAVGKLAGVCHGCHVENMAAVQHKYVWKDFSGIKVKDPITGQEVGFAEMMMFLSSGMSAIGGNLAQGQKDAAVKHMEAFKARFYAFEDTCGECHDSAREYYVDAATKGIIDDLAKEVGKAKPDPARVQQLTMTIGMESCYKCHLVHVPAALTKPRPPMGPPQ